MCNHSLAVRVCYTRKKQSLIQARKTNQRLIQESGLQSLSAQEETAEEDGVPVTFLWVVARKPLV